MNPVTMGIINPQKKYWLKQHIKPENLLFSSPVRSQLSSALLVSSTRDHHIELHYENNW